MRRFFSIIFVAAAAVAYAVTWHDFAGHVLALGEVPEDVATASDSVLQDLEAIALGPTEDVDGAQGGMFIWTKGSRRIAGVYLIMDDTPRQIAFFVSGDPDDEPEPIDMYIDGWDARRHVLTARSPEGAITTFTVLDWTPSPTDSISTN